MSKTKKYFYYLGFLGMILLSCAGTACAAGSGQIFVKVRVLADSTPPQGGIFINGGNGYTNASVVSLTLIASDGESGMGPGAQMRFSDDNISWSEPEDYFENKEWELATGDGLKSVYVKFKDAAGNWSEAYSTSIILDTTPPQLAVTSPLDNAMIRPE